MSDIDSQAREIFFKALDRESPEKLRAYVDEACGNGVRLRARVDDLLRAHENAGEFLGGSASVIAPIDMPPITEQVGSVIGPYKLREQIGEGGMGIVYVAQQTEPVHRKVALKLVKPGMDTKDVIIRFEAERQALALMDHPNIAKVHEAGTTDSGRPFFVMELVRGIPITEYCDKAKLTTGQRLDLFIKVCRAVQHAHQKGIIHRDIKPTNVLVTQIDGAAVPKVIDFGVAKAINRELTEQSVYTQFAQMVGTPLYMSPEQAEMTSHDIDTRSDVYSLGVLLYELLTGTTPFEKETLKEAGFDEMRRIIREDEPPRPSDRISTLNAEALSTVAAHRSIDARRFSHLVQGELDWIVMRALEKDRTRRYESASAFAADVERYLNDNPVEACPPSAMYRFRKFTWRNRSRLATTFVVLASIFAVAGFALNSRWERESERESRRLDREAQRLKRDQKRNELVQQIEKALTEAQSFLQRAAGGDLDAWTKARQMAERAETLAKSELVEGASNHRVHALLTTMAEEEQDRHVIADLEAARMIEVESLNFKGHLFQPEFAVPKYERAFRSYGIELEHMTFKQAVARINSRPPAVQMALLAGLDRWVDLMLRFEGKIEASKNNLKITRERIEWTNTVIQQADTDQTRKTIRQAVQKRDFETLIAQSDSIKVDEHPPYFLLYMAEHVWWDTKEHSTAVALLRRSRKQYPGDFFINGELGRTLRAIKPPQLDESLRFQTVASALRPDNMGVLLHLSLVLMDMGRLEDATDTLRKALRRRVQTFNTGFDKRYKFILDLAAISELQIRIGDDDEAFHTFSRALDLWENLAGDYPNQLEYRGAAFLLSVWTYRERFLKAQETSLRRVLRSRAVSGIAKVDVVTFHLIRHLSFVSLAMEKSHEADNLTRKLESFAKRLVLQFPNDRSCKATINASRAGSLTIAAYCRNPKIFNPERALTLALTEVQEMPTNSFQWRNLAVARYVSEDWQGAIEALEKSRVLEDNRPRLGELILACVYARLGRSEEAQNSYEKAFSNSHDPDHYILGQTYFSREFERLSRIPIKASKPKVIRETTSP